MALSRQLDILQRLSAHLEGITPGNGYDFDMAGKVFRGKVFFGDDDPLPMIAILELLQPDADLQMAGLNESDHAETWVLLIQGFIEGAANNPTDEAYQFKAAVEQRLSDCIATDAMGNPVVPAAYMLGLYKKGISGLSIGPGLVSPPREGVSAYSFFYLPIGIDRTVELTKPFV